MAGRFEAAPGVDSAATKRGWATAEAVSRCGRCATRGAKTTELLPDGVPAFWSGCAGTTLTNPEQIPLICFRTGHLLPTSHVTLSCCFSPATFFRVQSSHARPSYAYTPPVFLAAYTSAILEYDHRTLHVMLLSNFLGANPGTSRLA